MSFSFQRNRSNSNGNSNKRPRRGCVYELASLLVPNKANNKASGGGGTGTEPHARKTPLKTVCITGAGLSVASGVRPFRGQGGVWSSVLYERGTRRAFRKNPLEWYTKFWLPHFGVNGMLGQGDDACNDTNDEEPTVPPLPNAGHEALQDLMDMLPPSSFTIVTQNIDGLHHAAAAAASSSSTNNSNNNSHNNIIEAHGRLGLFKCIPDSDSDTDSDSDENDDRLVHVGHRRKSRALRRAYYDECNARQQHAGKANKHDGSTAVCAATISTTTRSSSAALESSNKSNVLRRTRSTKTTTTRSSSSRTTSTTTSSCLVSSSNNTTSTPGRRVPCRYELVDSIPLHQVHPPTVVPTLLGRNARQQQQQQQQQLTTPPCCPACFKPCPPQALLFDEGYHSHDFYQFERIEDLLAEADILVLVGTSFASGVRITQVALEHARKQACNNDNKMVRVYNFNTVDRLESTSELMVQNVMGPAQETLPRLVEACREMQTAAALSVNDNDDDDSEERVAVDDDANDVGVMTRNRSRLRRCKRKGRNDGIRRTRASNWQRRR